MHVVATAGHVDHGKSTLVRALTGMEPDRWAEERRRGMTIDLGFAWTPDRSLAFVDVPGHERFVKNMLAGVGPVPAVLLVVAADGGWMPQSEEHLAVLDALAVRHGVLALTRADLAAPADADALREQVLDRLAATSLGRLPAVAVSGTTGEGLDTLRALLAAMTGALPPPDLAADVRLWVDRAFTVAGAGTVVTGTLPAGRLRVGDELEVAATGARPRVRGLQVLGRPAAEVAAVARVAVNLRGPDLDAVARGHALVTPGRWLATTLVDARLSGAVPLPRHVVLHVGAAAVPATVRPLGDDVVRVTLAEALPLRVGDRVLLRDAGSRTVAGARLLDVRPPALTRRGAAAERARDLRATTGDPDLADELRRRGLVPAATLRAVGVDPAGGPEVAGWVVQPALWARAGADLAALVAGHAASGALTAGPTTEEARARLGLPDRALVLALARQTAGVEARDGRLVPATGADDAERLPPAVREAVRRVAEGLAGRPFHAPEAPQLGALGLGAAQLAAAVRAGLLLRVGDGVYLLPGADRAAVEHLAGLDQPFTASSARQALGTTRRVALPLLEHLDRVGLTERVDDQHRRVVPR